VYEPSTVETRRASKRHGLNSPGWWRQHVHRQLARGDLRDRPAEFKVAAAHCGSPVLEVGPSFGTFTKYLKPGTQYLGVDISPDYVREARKRFPEHKFLCADILSMGRRWYGAFDTAVALQVLEHFERPELVMDKLYHLARRRLVFSIPKGLYSPADRQANGHVAPGWKDALAVESWFSRWGAVTLLDGADNHWTGMVDWRKR